MHLSAAILGAGQCFRKMLPGLRRYFSVCAIYDPDPTAVGLSCLTPDEKNNLLRSEEELFQCLSRLDTLFILSPPGEHVRQVEQACSFGKPVFVEKPLATNDAGLEILNTVLIRNPRVYFSDFYADVRAVALLKAFGGIKRDVKWIEPFLSPSDEFPFLEGLHERLGEIHLAKGRLLEQAPQEQGIPARKWLTDPVQGGVLLDLAYHYLTLFFTLFEESLFIEECYLGWHQAGQPGTSYEPWSPKLESAETYSFLVLRSSSGIPFEIEVSNQWRHEACEFHIKGSKGELMMNFGGSSGKKNVLHVTSCGQTITYKLAPYYWDLVALGFHTYVTRPVTKPHRYLEGKAALKTILEAKEQAPISNIHH